MTTPTTLDRIAKAFADLVYWLDMHVPPGKLWLRIDTWTLNKARLCVLHSRLQGLCYGWLAIPWWSEGYRGFQMGRVIWRARYWCPRGQWECDGIDYPKIKRSVGGE